MTELELDGILVSEIIPKLAEKFETEYKNETKEYTLNLPEKMGEGKISGLNFPNGVGIIFFKMKLKEKLVLKYMKSAVHPLRFIYCLKSNIEHQFNDEDTELIKEYHSAIIAARHQQEQMITFEKDTEIETAFLEINRKTFIEHISKDIFTIDMELYELFFDIYATKKFFHNGLYSLQLARIMESINKFEYKNFLRTNYIGAKALEMLSYMLIQYQDDLKAESRQEVLRQSELKAVQKAVAYIDANLKELGTVENIAEEVDLPSSKLQEGFKVLFNNTVNEFIQNRRLEEAARLLRKGDMNISEVVYAIGLNSRSYFSKIFKEKYEISPSEFIKMNEGS